MAPTAPPLPDGVIDLSANVPVDSWMANPDTDLLKGHRIRGLRNFAIGLGVAAVVIGVVIVLARSSSDDDGPSGDTNAGTSAEPIDAGSKHPPPLPPDAGISKDDILAISRFGYLTITANQRTTIYIDGKNIGETPMTRLPLAPGPKKIKAIGPKNKKKELTTTILGGQDAEPIDLVW
jgi:hypothetical protein